MEPNLGTIDRAERLLSEWVAGVASLGVLTRAVPLSTHLSPALGPAAPVLPVTGTTGSCGLDSLFGVETN